MHSSLRPAFPDFDTWVSTSTTTKTTTNKQFVVVLRQQIMRTVYLWDM